MIVLCNYVCKENHSNSELPFGVRRIPHIIQIDKERRALKC